MKTTERRLRALESAAAPQRPTVPLESMPMFEVARRLLFTIREGVEARKELDAADASLNPGRRAELTKRLDLARSIASALEKYSPRRETPPSARAIIPGSLDALLVELIAISPPIWWEL